MSLHDDDIQTHVGSFRIIPNFDAQSRNGSVCSITGLPKQEAALGRPAEQVDDFVLRGPMIDHEGFFDIRPYAVIETAKDLGMVPAEEHQAVLDIVSVAAEQRDMANAEAAALQQQLDGFQSIIRESLMSSDESEDVLDQADTVRFADMPEDDDA